MLGGSKALLLLCSCLLVLYGAHAMIWADEEEEALMAMKASIQEDPQGLLSDWKQGTDPCTWRGIGCDASSRVISVTITSRSNEDDDEGGGGGDGEGDASSSDDDEGMWDSNPSPRSEQRSNAGEAGPSLRRLPEASRRKLRGTIAPAVGNLTRLRRLSMPSNALFGKIPDGISSLRDLEWIDLAGNELSGSLPRHLGRLSELKHLDLGHNSLGGQLPSGRSFRKLRFLSLAGNRIGGPIPVSFSGIPELEILDLSSNLLVGSIPPRICSGSTRHLHMEDNLLTGSIPRGLGRCSSLRTLKLSSNLLSGSIPAEIGSLPRLEVLDVSMNRFDGSVPRALARCKQLAALILTRTSADSAIDDSSIADASTGCYRRRKESNAFSSIPIEQLIGLPRLQILWAPGAISSSSSSSSSSGRLSNLHHRSWGGGKSLRVLNLARSSLAGTLPPAAEWAGCRRFMRLDGESGNNEWEGILDLAAANCPWRRGDLNRNGWIRRCGGGEEMGLRRRQRWLLSYEVGCGKTRMSVHWMYRLGGWGDGQGKLEARVSCFLGAESSSQSPSSVASGWASSASSASTASASSSASSSSASASSSSSSSSSSSAAAAAAARREVYEASPGSGALAPSNEGEPLELGSSGGGGRRHGMRTVVIAAAASGAIVGAVFIFFLVLFAYLKGWICVPGKKRRRRRQQQQQLVLFENTATLGGGGGIEGLTYDALVAATANFSVNSYIGSGGYGTTYRAELGPRVVAVKKIYLGKFESTRQFEAEVRSLGKLRHPNLVTLIGYYASDDEMLLLYNYLPGGNLLGLIQRDDAALAVGWRTRYRIALDVARALAYLHDERTLHRDVKPSNVLLDKDLNAFLSDFGLARLLAASETHVTTDVLGTLGYVAPEYVLQRRASDKSDVYSYGVLVLVLLSGRKAIDGSFSDHHGPSVDIVAWARQLHERGKAKRVFAPGLWDLGPHSELTAALALALDCTVDARSLRPSMRQVVDTLTSL